MNNKEMQNPNEISSHSLFLNCIMCVINLRNILTTLHHPSRTRLKSLKIMSRFEFRR